MGDNGSCPEGTHGCQRGWVRQVWAVGVAVLPGHTCALSQQSACGIHGWWPVLFAWFLLPKGTLSLCTQGVLWVPCGYLSSMAGARSGTWPGVFPHFCLCMVFLWPGPLNLLSSCPQSCEDSAAWSGVHEEGAELTVCSRGHRGLPPPHGPSGSPAGPPRGWLVPLALRFPRRLLTGSQGSGLAQICCWRAGCVVPGESSRSLSLLHQGEKTPWCCGWVLGRCLTFGEGK